MGLAVSYLMMCQFVCKDHANGASVEELAVKYNCTTEKISEIVSGFYAGIDPTKP